MNLTAEVGITYAVEPSKAPDLYKRYRRGIDEITDTFVHNQVRSILIKEASTMPVEEIYSSGRAKLLANVQNDITKQLAPQGIIVQNLYWVGELGLPPQVKAAIGNKVQAIQKAQQIENEVAQSKAEAQKKIAVAEGDAKSTLIRAQSQADANQKLAQSLTPALVEYMKIQKWDGKLPRVGGGAGIMLQMKE